MVAGCGQAEAGAEAGADMMAGDHAPTLWMPAFKRPTRYTITRAEAALARLFTTLCRAVILAFSPIAGLTVLATGIRLSIAAHGAGMLFGGGIHS